MDSTNTDLHSSRNKFALTYIERKAVELLSILLADVTTDAEVAARDAGISDASFVRLRRALDWVACAQSVLETMSVGSKGASGDGMPKCTETEVREMVTRQMAMRKLAIRDAVELLARGWPDDYPAGAVEWLIAGRVSAD